MVFKKKEINKRIYTKAFTLMLSETQYADLQKVAVMNERSVASYIRHVLNNAAKEGLENKQ
jgi:hypothetical protein